MYIHVLMRDEKKERKKQVRSHKQQQGKATYMYMYIVQVHAYIHSLATCCFALFGYAVLLNALFVCLTLLASFFLPSHLSFKNMYLTIRAPSRGNYSAALEAFSCVVERAALWAGVAHQELLTSLAPLLGGGVDVLALGAALRRPNS